VDLSTAALQNEFNSYKLSLHKKTIVFKKLPKHEIFFITFIFYHKGVVKQESLFVELYKHRFVMQLLPNPPS
jgi:hypothetical protein